MTKSSKTFFIVASTISVFASGYFVGAEYTKRHIAEVCIQTVVEGGNEIYRGILDAMTETEEETIARTKRDIVNFKASQKLWKIETDKIDREFEAEMKKLEEWERKEIEKIDNILKGE